jgi:D-glycerate 3-kinase
MTERMNIPSHISQQCQHLIESLRLPENFIDVVENIYFPLAVKLMNSKQQGPLMICINGAQGTGKSTLTQFIKVILGALSTKSAAAFSIDDFYLTRSQRQQLAKKIHPLFMTRGVPGTHDIDLMKSVLNNLLNGNNTQIPVFNKAIDDRESKDSWQTITEPVDFILFEGWCVLSPPQAAEELVEPINELEKKEDPNTEWRRYANLKLTDYHQQLFSLTDVSVMLQPPDFDHIYQWRTLQEEKLRESTQSGSHQLMDADSLKRFIQHYERITRHTLAELPEQVDYLLPVDKHHNISGIIERNERR